jgi:hypothetical protein
MISDKQINEIGQDLQMGMRCFLNPTSDEVLIHPDFLRMAEADKEPWADVLEELEENFHKYCEIENLSSHDSFRIMEDFIETVHDKRFQKSLISSLNRNNPFRNFKNLIENSNTYRLKWFAFRDQRYFEWVKQQIDSFYNANRGSL